MKPGGTRAPAGRSARAGLGARALAAAFAAATFGSSCCTPPAASPPPPADPLAAVRRQLEERYAENEAGFFARDPDRVMRLRHPDFHTLTPDGKRNTREQMAQRTREFIGRIERFDSLTETITALTLENDTACAIIDQHTRRQQRLPDGLLHEIQTSVVQRECWKRAPTGWLMWRVDEIHPGSTLVDGKPVQPNP